MGRGRNWRWGMKEIKARKEGGGRGIFRGGERWERIPVFIRFFLEKDQQI